ncbi:MAG: hypothetical protein D6812_01425 [Deltaproteobacteria bacterium]|nr:MAG: hypothetical protein D6812_01425 [Deltaproteobacteria bacterium]
MIGRATSRHVWERTLARKVLSLIIEVLGGGNAIPDVSIPVGWKGEASMIETYVIEEIKRQRERKEWEPLPLQIEQPAELPEKERKEDAQRGEKKERKPSIIVIDL